MKPIHERIEEIRIRKGVTKTHIAKYCGHSVTWYKDISKGRRGLSATALEKIAEALDVSPAEFFEQKVSETRTTRSDSA